MKNLKSKWVAISFCILMLGFVAIPSAKADSWNQDIRFTVSKAPLEIPGHVLPPGKYDMRFLNFDHDFVFVRTAKGEPIGFFDVVPIYRGNVTDNVKLGLSKANKGRPARLTRFYYPEMNTGYEFMYPHSRIARSSHIAQARVVTGGNS
jgi:hypothetical protein